MKTDFYQIDDLFSTDHILIRKSIKDFVEKEIQPIIVDSFSKGNFPESILRKMGTIGIFGATIPLKYGGSELDYISYGLMMQELEFCDSGIRSAASVQNSLVMFPINEFGSEIQKQKYLPRLASGEYIGCFGLTEPNHGSDPSNMETKIVDKGDYFELNGSKTWISNAPIADIAIVWARNEKNRVVGIILEKNMIGFSRPEIKGKLSLKASCTGELYFDQVKVPKENILPLKDGLGAPIMCLDKARYGISWGAIGAAISCYETALKYSLERKQFGKSIASFQLTQKKLAEMLTDITKAQLLSFRLGQLMNQQKATTAQISMAKRNNVAMALNIARESRQILGGMGITEEFPIMRHIMNLESVVTYEGTHDIHLLILGKEITGISAFE